MSRDEHDDPLYRREWPIGDIRGRFLFLEDAVRAVERLLPTYRGPDGDHEGICFLCGFETKGFTVYTTAIAPNAGHGYGNVSCSDEQMAEVAQKTQGLGLGLLAQVHSHPGSGTGHSYGDDEMIFMPFEEMLSIVVPNYARFGVHPLDSLGVHQFQNGQWVLCTRESIRSAFTVVPSGIDLR